MNLRGFVWLRASQRDVNGRGVHEDVARPLEAEKTEKVLETSVKVDPETSVIRFQILLDRTSGRRHHGMFANFSHLTFGETASVLSPLELLALSLVSYPFVWHKKPGISCGVLKKGGLLAIRCRHNFMLWAHPCVNSSLSINTRYLNVSPVVNSALAVLLSSPAYYWKGSNKVGETCSNVATSLKSSPTIFLYSVYWIFGVGCEWTFVDIQLAGVGWNSDNTLLVMNIL